MVREATGAVGKLFQKHDEIRSDYNEKQRHTAEDLTMSGVKIRFHLHVLAVLSFHYIFIAADITGKYRRQSDQ